MAYSTITTTGNGVLTSFTFPFSYNHPTDIVVKVGGVVTSYTFTSANTIQLASAPANGVPVEITRITPISAPEVIFASPGALSPVLMNRNTDQLLYAVQEIWDNTEDTRDALNRRISIGETPPFNPQPGDLWFDTTTAILFVYYNDGSSSQWVESNNANPGWGGGGTVDLADATGVLPIEKGGTNATTAAGARTNLGLKTGALVNISVGTTAPSTPAVGDLWVDTN